MNKEETRTRIGQRVKALRLMAELSQDELAQRAGLQRTHIGRIEGGKYAVNIETLQAIAEALGMTRLYQRKAMYYQAAGPLNREDAEYCCEPDLRYILKGEGFADTELKPYTHVLFRYGYTQRCFINRIDSITIGRGNPEWGAPTDRDVFIIRHHREPSPFIKGKEL